MTCTFFFSFYDCNTLFALKCKLDLCWVHQCSLCCQGQSFFVLSGGLLWKSTGFLVFAGGGIPARPPWKAEQSPVKPHDPGHPDSPVSLVWHNHSELAYCQVCINSYPWAWRRLDSKWQICHGLRAVEWVSQKTHNRFSDLDLPSIVGILTI